MPKPPLVYPRGDTSTSRGVFDQKWGYGFVLHREDGPAWVLTHPPGMILRWRVKGAELIEIHPHHVATGGGIWFSAAGQRHFKEALHA